MVFTVVGVCFLKVAAALPRIEWFGPSGGTALQATGPGLDLQIAQARVPESVRSEWYAWIVKII